MLKALEGCFETAVFEQMYAGAVGVDGSALVHRALRNCPEAFDGSWEAFDDDFRRQLASTAIALGGASLTVVLDGRRPPFKVASVARRAARDKALAELDAIDDELSAARAQIEASREAFEAAREQGGPEFDEARETLSARQTSAGELAAKRAKLAGVAAGSLALEASLPRHTPLQGKGRACRAGPL